MKKVKKNHQKNSPLTGTSNCPILGIVSLHERGEREKREKDRWGGGGGGKREGRKHG